MADMGILELAGIVAALSAGLGGPIAVIKWCASFVGEKITESEKAMKVTIDTQGHKINNVTARVDAMERLRVADVERLVKLETNYANLERGQARIEHALEKMEADQEKGRAEIIDSIRELRNVALKD